MNVLFVCSRNQWRSLTAEHLFKKVPGLAVRSAGTSAKARVKVTTKLLAWADLVLVMERRHQEILQQKFPEIISGKELHVLNIPDEYEYMGEELVRILKEKVATYFEHSDTE